MTKVELLEMLNDNFKAGEVRDLVRYLRDEYEYDFRSTATKDELIDQLGVTKKDDLIEALDEVYPDWDEEDSEEEEDDSDEEDGEEEEEEPKEE
jgi:hypothetical protein